MMRVYILQTAPSSGYQIADNGTPNDGISTDDVIGMRDDYVSTLVL